MISSKSEFMRLALIGPSDMDYYACEILGVSKEELFKRLEGVVEQVGPGKDLLLLAAPGIAKEFSSRYKKKYGCSVWATMPKQDTYFGTDMLDDDCQLYDEIIDSGTWFEQDLLHALYGDAVLMLGTSLGTLGELVYGIYCFDLLKKGIGKRKEEMIALNHEKLQIHVAMSLMPSKLDVAIEKYGREKGAVFHYF